ncbi:hypothetical protein Efla_002155 [Eimeria flavescens]
MGPCLQTRPSKAFQLPPRRQYPLLLLLLQLLLLLLVSTTCWAAGGRGPTRPSSSASGNPQPTKPATAAGAAAEAAIAAAAAEAAAAAAEAAAAAAEAAADRRAPAAGPSPSNRAPPMGALAGKAYAAASLQAAGPAAAAEAARAAAARAAAAAGATGEAADPQEDAGEDGEGRGGVKQPTVNGNAAANLVAQSRPMLAPFVRHYSKYMAILWEWYTKTIGATMHGRRRQDEDALVVHAPALFNSNVRFKALFDGHGGSSVSRTCVAQFCNFYGGMPDLDAETFRETSLLLDELICQDSARHKRGGSTGLVVAIERPQEHLPKFTIHVSNIGDSRAFILHQNGTYTIMTKDHKPNDPVEAARIANAGGFVTRGKRVFRVDGTLSVSRAFGDLMRVIYSVRIRMKLNPHLPPTEQKVIAVPDVRKFEAREGDYIFMACDGMFEAPGMSWDFVANLLYRELQNTNDNLVETVFRMLNTAYLLGSADNISIVLTKLMNRKRSSSTVKRFLYDYLAEEAARACRTLRRRSRLGVQAAAAACRTLDPLSQWLLLRPLGFGVSLFFAADGISQPAAGCLQATRLAAAVAARRRSEETRGSTLAESIGAELFVFDSDSTRMG